jgi:hypothetical protein
MLIERGALGGRGKLFTVEVFTLGSRKGRFVVVKRLFHT